MGGIWGRVRDILSAVAKQGRRTDARLDDSPSEAIRPGMDRCDLCGGCASSPVGLCLDSRQTRLHTASLR